MELRKVHFVGIGGIGLSALARFLKEQGYTITGSDIKQTTVTDELEQEGMSIGIPHDKKYINDQDFIIYSAAIRDDNVELVEARRQGKITLSRKESLPMILKEKRVFSVAGAHGKSTTSAMLASIIDGSVIIGAVSKQFGSNMFYKESDNLIFEADESDESFLNSNPYIAIVTNAEPEHMEFYNYDYERFYNGYRNFLNSASIRVINAEDEFLGTLNELEAIRLYPSRDIKGIKTIVKNGEPFTSFNLKDLGTFEVWGVGDHIALDAGLAILASLNEHDIETIREKLKNFRGIRKRFDIIKSNKNYALIDDYAHHPTEIKATLDSAKKYANALGFDTINVIWQPHKFSRTLDNMEGFKRCFEGIDNLLILPVYSAGESPRDIDFEKEFSKYAPFFSNRITPDENGVYFSSVNNEVRRFDKGLVIGLGAGDITYQLRGVS